MNSGAVTYRNEQPNFLVSSRQTNMNVGPTSARHKTPNLALSSRPLHQSNTASFTNKMAQAAKTPNSSTMPRSMPFGRSATGPGSKRQSFDKSTSSVINQNCGIKKVAIQTTKNRSATNSNFVASAAETTGPTNIMIYNNNE